MKSRDALILTGLITLCIVLNVFIFQKAHTISERESIVIERAIDGDTFTTTTGESMRLANINTPEKNEFFYDEAKQFLQQFENQTIEIERIETDKYGRTIVRAFAPEYINEELVKHGLAKKFLVHEDEYDIFATAELQAIETEQGRWQHSPHYGCFTTNIDAVAERVVLANNCAPLSLNTWSLTDESRKIYKFESRTIGTLIVQSAHGNDNETEVFWNQNAPVWNNDYDTLYLFDAANRIAHVHAYNNYQ